MTTLPTTTPVALALIVAGASATWLAASAFESGFEPTSEPGRLSGFGRERAAESTGIPSPTLARIGPVARTTIATPTRPLGRLLAEPARGSADEIAAAGVPPTPSAESEVTALLQRLDGSLALFEEPTPEALAQWHAGRSLAALAGATHDAQEATGWLKAREQAPLRFAAQSAIDGPLARLAERAASLEAERVWLYEEVDRQMCSPANVGSQHLHRLDDESLQRMFPTRRDRRILATLLNQEAYAIGRDAARSQIEAQRRAALAGEQRDKLSRFSFG